MTLNKINKHKERIAQALHMQGGGYGSGFTVPTAIMQDKDKQFDKIVKTAFATQICRILGLERRGKKNSRHAFKQYVYRNEATLLHKSEVQIPP